MLSRFDFSLNQGQSIWFSGGVGGGAVCFQQPKSRQSESIYFVTIKIFFFIIAIKLQFHQGKYI